VDEPLAVALKFGFLAVLYLFLLWVSRSALRDLARSEEPSAAAAPGEEPRRSRPRDQGSGGLMGSVSPRLEVVAALGQEPGTVLDIVQGATLGRSDSAEIHVDDPYASSAHARIYAYGDFMQLEDMGSTNGTYLNGRRVRGAERLKVADSIRIGDTEWRYQE